MPSILRTPLLFLCVALVSGTLHAQDLGQIGKQKPFTVSGGLNAFGAVYTTDSDDPRMSPFTWGVNGRMTIGIYDLQVPLSFIFSEKERGFRQPFNQYGISPRYKWATAHIGHRSMHFSELTMSGQRFFGGGLELMPKKFRFAAMYGQLRREVFADTLTEAIVEPTFQRMGMAAKIGVGTLASHVDLVIFRAKDRYDAIDLARGRYGTARPEENLVVGLETAFKLAKSLQMKVDVAGSLHNVGALPAERSGGFAELGNNYDSFLFNMDPRSRRGSALKAGLSYNLKGTTFSVNYDRIDPLFRTLGNYFFMNDVENYRGSIGTGLFKQKLRVMASLGLQSNDLARAMSARTRRTIGSMSLAYNSGKAFNSAFTWSNFEADLRSAYEAAGSDTIRLRQVSDNLTLTNSLRLRDADAGITRTMDLSLSYQDFVNEGYPGQATSSTVTWSGSLGYRQRNKPRSFDWGLRGSGSVFENSGNGRVRYGLSANARKGFHQDRTGVNARLACYLNRGERYGGSTTLVGTAGVDQRVGRQHRFGLGLNYNGRSTGDRLEQGQYQLRVQATYAMEFQPAPRKTTSP